MASPSKAGWGDGLVRELIASGRLPPDALEARRPGQLVTLVTTPPAGYQAVADGVDASSFPTSIEAKKPARRDPAPPKMNKTETRYQLRLLAQGHRPRFGAITLVLSSHGGRAIRYTPDLSLLVDGVIELHEVKGAHVYEDGKVKFEFAVEQWGQHYTFVWAQWIKGDWIVRRYPRRLGD